MFLIFFECRGATSEVVVYRDNLGVKTAKDRVNTITGLLTSFYGVGCYRWGVEILSIIEAILNLNHKK